MGLFDKLKGKKEPKEIFWSDSAEYVGNKLSVDQYIKRILNHYPKSSGKIYLNDKYIPYNYGNLGDIVSSDLLGKPVQQVQESVHEEDGTIDFRIVF